MNKRRLVQWGTVIGLTGAVFACSSGTPPRSEALRSSAQALENCPMLTSTSGSITDGSGNVWTLVTGSDGTLVIDENGSAAGYSDNVVELVDVGGVISQKNSSGGWWYWGSGTWNNESDPTGSCGSPSPNCTLVTSTSGTIVDSAGNAWTLATGGDGSLIVDENGSPAGYSDQVIELAYVGGQISQENASHGWWSWGSGTWNNESDPTTSCGSGADGGSGGGNLAIHVSGNHLVDANGTPIVLRGADVSNTEFICTETWTTDPYGGAPWSDPASFQAMRAWNINVIRVPLNEDCWLDINGVNVGGAPYISAIQAEVSAAHQAGLFVILDLHWSAPGTQEALDQQSAPDEDHSPSFWSSVASTFAADPAVIFDLYNEPYPYWGTDPDEWNAWLNGDTKTQYVVCESCDPYTVTQNWQSAGMQELVNVVRATGATQPIMVNGTDWSNDDSGWLSHVPSDPAGQLIAGAHIYPGNSCSDPTCWDSVFPAIGASYPILIGETGDNVSPPDDFLPGFLNYADSQNWNYLAWTWNPWQNPADVLVTDYAGTPNAGEGTVWKNHLAMFPFQN